jgi:hypothetical protein
MTGWKQALVLDCQRRPVEGGGRELADAIGRGADLRIGTEFRHNEHIDTASARGELVREVAQFAVTYLVDGRWTAGIMSQRQPVDLPVGFGPRPSMSFFLYNEDGEQAIARPFLDGEPAPGQPGPSPAESPADMLRYHRHDGWDEATNAPSHNFVYDFDCFRYFVRQRWEELLSHDADGNLKSGSVDALASAFSEGRAIKVGVCDLCTDLQDEIELRHEIFVETGSGYYYTEERLFIAGSHPVVRVRPAVPMRYVSQGWDFGWLVLRTDGAVTYRRCDPYTLEFQDLALQCPVRWFADVS